MSTPTSYQEFWPIYVRAHSRKSTRVIHALGTAGALGCLAAWATTGRKGFLSAAPVVGYGPAWISHFFIEGNKPATFGNPLWSLRGDFEMIFRMITGTMDAEVERHCAPPPAEAAVSTDVTVAEAVPVAAPDPTLN